MNRIWDAFKYPSKPFMTLCQIKVIQDHKVKEGQTIFLICVVWYVFGLAFRQTRKKLPSKKFCTSQIGQKIDIQNGKNWKSEKAEILVNGIKSVLSGIQNVEPESFSNTERKKTPFIKKCDTPSLFSGCFIPYPGFSVCKSGMLTLLFGS